MNKIIWIFFILSFIISQETTFELLPFIEDNKNIPEILIDNKEDFFFILNDDLIQNSIVNTYNSEYNLFEIKYKLKNKNKYRISLKINSFPDDGKLFISNSNSQFEGPIFSDQINFDNMYI